MMMI